MAKIDEIIIKMKENPKGISFSDLCKVCDHFFGDPRINIQNKKGKAKTYQVKQVLLALDRLEVNHGYKK